MINQKEFFDSIAEKWDTISNHNTDKIKDILTLINIKHGAKILDVGTGTGILVPFLREQVGEKGSITAVDVSSKMIEVAQRKYIYDNVSFVCADILDSDLPNEYFDFAICYSVFPHFNDKPSAIKAINKYLKVGGKFIICHSQSREAINNLHRNSSKVISEDNLPSIDVIKGYLKILGLKTITEIDNDEMFVIICIKEN